MHHAIAMPAPAGLSNLTDLERVYFGFLAEYRNKGTHASYEGDLQRFFTWCYANSIQPLHAERTHIALYVRHLADESGLRGSTVNSYMAGVKGFYKWGVVEGFIDRDPVVHIKLPRSEYRKKQPIEKSDLKALRRAAKDIGGRHWALGELLITHGLRISEACSLRIEDCQDVEAGHRVMGLTRKGGKFKKIPMPMPVSMAIDAAAGDRTRGTVVAKLNGDPMGRGTGVGLLRTICRHANLQPINPHLIRASVITFLANGDGGLDEGQRLADHEDQRTTRKHYFLTYDDYDTHPAHILSARLTAA